MAKSDLFIDQIPVMVDDYSRSSGDDLVARFGSAEQGETNLDMLKAQTQKSFAGGMFQRVFDDPERVSTLEGGYYNEADSKLYFALNEAGSQALSSFDEITAYAVHDDKIFVAVRANIPYPGMPWTNALYAFYDNDQTWRRITSLPAAIANSQHKITSMVVHRDRLFLSGNSQPDSFSIAGFGIFRLENTGGDGTGTTFVRIRQGAWRLLASFRDTFYAIGSNGLWSHTKEFQAGTDQAVGTRIKGVGNYYTWRHTTNFMREFNGALWVGKMDGLFRFDGVDVVKVLDYANTQMNDNFMFGEVWNGRLYYFNGLKFYRFDGVNIEFLADFSSVTDQVFGVSAAADRIMITVKGNTTSSSSDKWGQPMTETDVDVYTYSGFGFYKTYSQGCWFAQYGYSAYMIAGLNYYLFCQNDGYLNASSEPRYSAATGEYFVVDEEFTNMNRSERIDVISSEINNGYPSVDKMLSGVSIDGQYLDQLDKLEVYVRTEPQTVADADKEWTDWQLVWQKNADFAGYLNADYIIHDGEDDGVLVTPSKAVRYRRMQFRFIAAVEAGWAGKDNVTRFRSITMRYSLQPRQRLAWILGVSLTPYYSGVTERQMTDGSIDIRSANDVRSAIYNSMHSKKPILFYDIDRYKITAIAGDTLTLSSPLFGRDGDVIAFSSDEVSWGNRRIKKTANPLEVKLIGEAYRDVLGASSVSPAVGDEVRVSRLAYVTRVTSEVAQLNDANSSPDNPDDYGSMLRFELREL